MKPVRNLIVLTLLAGTLLSCAGPLSAPATPLPVPTLVTPLPTETFVPRPTAPATASATLSVDDWLARQNPIIGVAWSSDGETIAVAALSGVHLFDQQTGAIVHTLVEGEFLYPLVMDPQGKRLLAGNRVWDVDSGQLLYQLPETNLFVATFRPDGKTLATSDDHRVMLWDAETGELQKSLDAGFGDAFWGLTYGPDGNVLYAVSSDHLVKRMDVASGQFSQLFSLPEESCCTLFSPDVEYMIVNLANHGAGSKQLWDVEEGELIKDLGNCDSDVNFAAFHRDHQRFTIGPCLMDAQLWDASTQQLLHNFPSGSLSDLRPEWRSAAFSPDGTKIAFGNDMGEVLIWDADTYQLVNKLSISLESPLPIK